MAYLAPIHQPSSVRHAIKLNFLLPNKQDLIVAKANRLEIYAKTQDGLELQYSKTVYGRVVMLNKIRPMSATTDHLFVGTDRYMYFTLSWDASTKQLRTERSYIDQADKSARDSQTGDRCHVDPTGSYMTLELYEGVITIIPIVKQGRKQTNLEIGSLGEPLPIRIPEMFVRASTFFRNKIEERKEPPKMALLYEDNYKRVKLKIRRIAYSPGLSGDGPNADLEEVSGIDEELEIGSSHLLPVAEPVHGLIILGETSITYWESSLRHPFQRPLQEATIWVAWEQIDAQRYVLADEYGKLYLLMLAIDQRENVVGWQLDLLGETSKASVLVYLGQGQVYVGSHEGDSQVISIQPKALQLTQTLTNIAPILDFSIMDLGNRGGEGQGNEFSSGQARLVTGSGAFKDGSLRTVRSGVGLEELGLLDRMENVANMFALRSERAKRFDDILVVSFVDETRIFKFAPDGDVEELEDFKGLRLDAGTLLASSLGRSFLQVTRSSVRLLDSESGMSDSEWTPDKGQSVTAVSVDEQHVIVAVGGSSLVALSLTQDLTIVAERKFDAESQIACVTQAQTNASVCVIGFWGSSAISILSMKDFSTIHTTDAATEGFSVPRSLLVANVLQDQSPILFIAMADGHVVSYFMDSTTGTLSGKQSITLGTRQAEFRRLPRADGLENVFATCSQPSLIYGSEGRLVYSALTAEDATSVCPFNAEHFPNAIAIATKEDLKIAMIDEQRSTHTQGVHFGETVRRIAYSPSLKAFGLGTISRRVEDSAEVVQSHFKLADEMSFRVEATFELNPDELVESVMRAELPDGSGALVERFVLGTAFVDEDNADSVRGRIIIFEVTQDRLLKVMTETEVRGACRCLGMVEGRIVAALIKTVVIYKLDFGTFEPSEANLEKTASYRTSTAPIDLSITPADPATSTPATIAIADLMKSLSIVAFHPGSPTTDKPNDSLKEIARHFQTTWSTATALIAPSSHLLADAEGNLTVLSRETATDALPEDKRRLTATSEIRLGEVVNRIRPVSVHTAPNAVVVPRAFCATVDGGVYLFAVIVPEWQDRLMRLQAALAKRVVSPGGVPFALYRGFKNGVRDEGAEGPWRFVDGEIMEGFLSLGPEGQRLVVTDAGLVGTIEDEQQGDEGWESKVEAVVEEIRGVVEGLRRLR